MHFLSLVTLEIPEIIEDENTNKEIEEQIEKEKEVQNHILRELMLGKLRSLKTTFSREVTSCINDIMEPYSETTTDQRYLEFIDHTQELEYDYEKGTTDCIRLPNGTLVTENHPSFLKKYILHQGKVFQRDAGPLKKIYLFWSAMIKTAISLGELPKNFSDILNRVIMPEESVLPVETKEISIIPPEHEQIIKEIAMEPSPNKNERYLYRYGPAIVFLLNTGLRGGELLALGQSSIVPFLGRRGIKITHTLSRVKNREAGSKKRTKMILTPPKYPNSLRTIPLNKEAEFSLSCMMELYDKNRVFPDLILSTQNGVSPTIQNLANTLKKICKRAEIPEYNLHALRHTFATNLIRQTHNMGEIKEAAEIIGDNYEVIMRTYVHTDSERKVSLIDAMIA